MSKRAVVGVPLFIVALSCADSPPATQPANPEASVEDDRDYRDGLFDTLSDPRSSFSSARVTEVYRLGYVAGRRERSDVACREADERRRAGCVGIAARIATIPRATNAGTARCEEMVRPECAAAGPKGTRYAGGRAVAEQKASETGLPETATVLLAAYEHGYVRGFAHERRVPLQVALAQVGSGCAELITVENAREPFSPADRDALDGRCITIASEFVQAHARELVDPPVPH